MSVEVMAMVWKGFPASGSNLLCMLALADWCNDDGGSLHPSMASIAEKVRISESQARRIVHGFIRDGYLEVVGNAGGGAPGTTRQYRLNVKAIRALADAAEVEKARRRAARSTAGAHATPGASATPGMGATPGTDATPSAGATPGMGARDGLHGCAGGVAPMRETGSTHATRSTIEPPYEPSEEPPSGDGGSLTLAPPPATEPADPKSGRSKLTPEMRAACEATWNAYRDAYGARYGRLLEKNAKLAGQVVQFVRRVGQADAPGVAAFYLSHNDSWYVRRLHPLDSLLKDAEALHTQYLTGAKVTATKAAQLDKTQSNFDAAQEAKRMLAAEGLL